MKVLVTGGSGYIGSTICSALEDAGHMPIIIDSLATGNPDFIGNRTFYQIDISDKNELNKVLESHKDLYAVIHCAAKIIVPESVSNPIGYYQENVVKNLSMLNTIKNSSIKRIIFSSTAALYNSTQNVQVSENTDLKPISPYAKTKLAMEFAIEDYCIAYGLRGVSLRYFNPIGADPKMRSGPNLKKSTHIVGKLIEVSENPHIKFEIAGNNWNTKDGTAIRDYIHVWDLAAAHIKALEKIDSITDEKEPFIAINIGSGMGITVKEMIAAFEEITGNDIIQIQAPKRPGDTIGNYADITKAYTQLDWYPRMSLEQGLADAIKWHKKQS
jgi:UDP-glucose 4-epimerase